MSNTARAKIYNISSFTHTHLLYRACCRPSDIAFPIGHYHFVCPFFLFLIFPALLCNFVVCFSVGYSLKIMRIEYNFDVERGRGRGRGGRCDDVSPNYNYVNGRCFMQLHIDLHSLDIVKWQK